MTGIHRLDQRGRASALALLAALLVLAACSRRSVSSGSGSESHFIECGRRNDPACPTGAECVAGYCKADGKSTTPGSVESTYADELLVELVDPPSRAGATPDAVPRTTESEPTPSAPATSDASMPTFAGGETEVPGPSGIGGQAASGVRSAGGELARDSIQLGNSGTGGGSGEDGGRSILDSDEVLGSCREIQDAGLSTGDGPYAIRVGASASLAVHCLMSADGGGWTLVGNFPSPGSTAGVPGWSSGEAVGSSFTDLAQPFKLADSDINALRTYGFRAQGTASHCLLADGVSSGPCAIDTLLFWRATCSYSSDSNSPECNTAYRDVSFATPVPAGTPCEWHFGLTSASCDSASTMGTSHDGNHVFVGEYESFVHAFDGRTNEDPSICFWVR